MTKENRQELDKIIHRIVSVRYEDCPATWKEVKKIIEKDREDFISELRRELKEHK